MVKKIYRRLVKNAYIPSSIDKNTSVSASSIISSTVGLLRFVIHILEPDVPHVPQETALVPLRQILPQPRLDRVRGPCPGVLELVRRLLVHVQEDMGDVPQVNDILERAIDPIPSVVDDFGAIGEALNPIP